MTLIWGQNLFIIFPGLVNNKYDPGMISLLTEKAKLMKRLINVCYYSELSFQRFDPRWFVTTMIPNPRRTPFFMKLLSGNASENIPQNQCNSVG